MFNYCTCEANSQFAKIRHLKLKPNIQYGLVRLTPYHKVLKPHAYITACLCMASQPLVQFTSMQGLLDYFLDVKHCQMQYL